MHRKLKHVTIAFAMAGRSPERSRWPPRALAGSELSDAPKGAATSSTRARAVSNARSSAHCPTGRSPTAGILVNAPGATNVGAVTGGTGSYRNSRGEATVLLGTNRHEIRFVRVG